ncbi:ABC transporter permease [Pseudorhodoferax sp.]|uniref:ABC transporter permease n=1 Tax=Pseudorhodoferax sp. TaxID=1993553 RepID=UPI002DD691FD|nr:ABC transporter permease [Pseudorhodoferax sp.]
MKELAVVIEQLRHQRLHTAVLLASIALTFAAYAVLGSLRYSLDSGEESVSGQRLIVTPQSGLMAQLPMAHKARIEALPGVAAVGHATWLGAYYQSQRQMQMVFAVQPQAWLEQHPDMRLAPAAAEAFLGRRDSMLVSRGLAERYGWEVGDVVPLGSILFQPPAGEPAWRLRVAGLFTSDDSGGGRNYIVMHYDTLNEARALWRDTVGSFMVTARPGVPLQALANDIDARFAATSDPTNTATDQAFHNEFFAQFGNVAFMIKAVIAAAFGSLTLVVASTLALTVRQGTRDIGVLKVLGWSHARVLRLVFWRSAALVLAGSAAGIGLGALFNLFITRRLSQFMPDVVLPWPVLGEAVFIALATGLATGLLPALLALRVRPLQALSVDNG